MVSYWSVSLQDVGNRLSDAVLFSSINYRTTIKLCGIVSYRLDGSLRYFCGIYVRDIMPSKPCKFNAVIMLWGFILCYILEI